MQPARRCYLQVEGAQQPGRLEDLAQQRVGQRLLHALQHRVAARAGVHVQLAQHRLEAIVERRPAEAAQHAQADVELVNTTQLRGQLEVN